MTASQPRNLSPKMFKKIAKIIGYVTKTTFFFLVVGGLVGTSFMPPFMQTFTHRPFRLPEGLIELLLGLIIVGMPYAACAGAVYGTCLAAFRPENLRRAIWAFGSGTVPVILTIFAAAIQNPRWSFDLPMSVVMLYFGMALFTGFSSLVTAWLHWKAEQRFTFLRAPSK